MKFSSDENFSLDTILRCIQFILLLHAKLGFEVFEFEPTVRKFFSLCVSMRDYEILYFDTTLSRPGGHRCPLSQKFKFYFKKGSSKKFPMSVAPMRR